MESRMKPFGRHLFRTGCACPTKLYYKGRSEYSENRDHMPFISHILYNKRELLKLLKSRYPKGINIERGTTEQVTADTNNLLERENVVLFNASFYHNGLFARIPVLEKEEERVRIYYLQTKAFDPERHSLTNAEGTIYSKWRDYIRDISYLLHVIHSRYPSWELDPRLVLPDKSAKVQSAELPEADNLLTSIPVMNEVRKFWEGEEPLLDNPAELPGWERLSYGEAIDRLAEQYYTNEKIDTGLGQKCARCEFRVDPDRLKESQKSGFAECWNPVLKERTGEDHIFDLIGSGNAQLLEQEIFLQQEIALEEELSPDRISRIRGKITPSHRRILQIAKAQGVPVPDEIVKPRLLREIGEWEYPLYFLDFEAGSYAVPSRPGKAPYDQVIFQYSCHILREDHTLEHTEWIDPGDGSYPNYSLIDELQGIPGIPDGTIVHYSGFERSALKQIRRELNREREEGKREVASRIAFIDRLLQGRSGRMADMGRLLQDYYYNREMEDSLSVKEVLPAVMKISPVLQSRFSYPYSGSNFSDMIWIESEDHPIVNPYKRLLEHDGRRGHSVGRGTEAMVAYSRLQSGKCGPEEAHQLRDALRRYCELDTLAMVMIYLHWDSLT